MREGMEGEGETEVTEEIEDADIHSCT